MPLIRLLCLTLLLSLSSLALTSAADDDGTWTYSLSGDEAIVTGCVASCPEDLVIPAIINGYNVVHIGRSAFFEYRLTSVIIPNGVRSIGYEAFANNQLTSVIIPDSMTIIDSNAFKNNQLANIIIPKGVERIDDGAFSENLLASIVVPDSVYQIGILAFGSNQLESVVIPNSVTRIGQAAFANNKLASVVIPNSLTHIYPRTFHDNELVDVVIPDGVIRVWEGAFGYNQLTSLTIADSVTEIGDDAFRNNQLTKVMIPDSVLILGDGAFLNNKLSSITIPDRLTSISESAFQNNQLTNVTIPDSVTKVGISAFRDNQLTSLIIPNSITTVGNHAFRDNQLNSVTLGAALDSIGLQAFSGNELTSIFIPDSISNLAYGVFAFNQLASITFSKKVVNISDSSFANNQLTNLLFLGDRPQIDEDSFTSNPLKSVGYITGKVGWPGAPVQGVMPSADYDRDGISDNDGDGIPDDDDAFPDDISEAADSDSDGIGNNADFDDDNDGVLDADDALPLDKSESVDSDGDGVGNNADTDDDDDGLSDAIEINVLGTDPLLKDTDGDTTADDLDAFPLDASEATDTDDDGIGNNADSDDDNDGYSDFVDSFPIDYAEHLDSDGDGIGDNKDDDDDNDDVVDQLDFYPLDPLRYEYCCQKALIVAGGGPYFGNALWPATKNMANFAYETLRFQGLDDEDIIYLSEEESGIVDGVPTNESVRQAIIGLADSTDEQVEDVLIYMVDHGGDGVFKLDEQTLLYAEDLKVWLDELHLSYDGKSTVIYDACESGSFVPLLAANDGSQRVVITSSAAKQPAVFALNGYTSFSYFFWSSFYVGSNISDSQILAKQAMSLIWGQDPKFDANGDGLANTKSDKVSIEDFFFGQRAAKASDNPIVGEIQLDTELNGESEVPIRVVEVVGGTSVNKVLVFIDDPDSYIPLPDEPLIEANGTELSQNEDGSWSGVLNGFTIAGNYDVSVVAQNSGGLFSIPDESDSVTVTQLKGRQPVIELDTDFDGLGDLTDADDDNDGVEDTSDDFPLDASESKDSDRDGVGNNADLDDDNDGFTDEEELADGTDPLSRFSCRSGCFSFDVDESLKAQPLTDGLLVIRHLFGFSGDALTSGAVASDANRDASEVIASYLTDADSQLDIDGDGESKPLTDGLLLIRYLFGFSGDSLISGAIGSDATRDTAETVEAYIKERVPSD